MFPFMFCILRAHRNLHSFPTRRSSDLNGIAQVFATSGIDVELIEVRPDLVERALANIAKSLERVAKKQSWTPEQIGKHTSELQSRRDLVCRLLLEKKKQYNK